MQRLYQKVLGRGSDVSGLNAHTGGLISGGTAADLALSFFLALEFTNRRLSNDQKVEIAYQTMLNRGTDPAGKANWCGRLDAGMPLNLLVAGFSGSGEFQKLCRTYGIIAGNLPFDAGEAAKYASSNGGQIGEGASDPAAPLSASIAYTQPVKCGQSTKFIFEAAGGSGDYRFMPYSLMIKDGSSWVQVVDLSYQSFTAKGSFDFTFSMSGDYRLAVAAMSPPDYTYQRFAVEFIIAADQGPTYSQRIATAEAKADEAWEQCQQAGCATDYDKALWLHDWIIDYCEYDYDLLYCRDVDLFADGKGTCEAYHAAYMKLLRKAGIECGRIYDAGHVWTLVKMDGEWYNVDTTHDDAAGTDWFGLGDDEEYLYFGLTEKIISDVLAVNGGVIKGQSVQADAVSLDDNYFIKSGRIKHYSAEFASAIQSHLDEGDMAFELSVPSRLSSGKADLPATSKTILYSLVAYDLETSPWTVSGERVTLKASYGSGKLSIEVAHA